MENVGNERLIEATYEGVGIKLFSMILSQKLLRIWLPSNLNCVK